MTEECVIEAVVAPEARDPLDVICGIPAQSPVTSAPPETRPMTSVEVAWDLAH